MTKLRISIVEYLNTAPLVWGFTDGPLAGRYDLSFTVPSKCAEALRVGDVDVAIIPAIEYQRMENVVLLPEMCVAASGEVRSILVIARKPIELAKRVALDTSSRSSAALVQLLCRNFWGISPEFVPAEPDPAAMLANADAALVIGDPALRIAVKLEQLAAKKPNRRILLRWRSERASGSGRGFAVRIRCGAPVARNDGASLRAGGVGRAPRGGDAGTDRGFHGVEEIRDGKYFGYCRWRITETRIAGAFAGALFAAEHRFSFGRPKYCRA